MRPYATDRFIVLTGGPGAGKTTIIDRLRRAGHPAMPDSPRAVLQHQSAIGGRGLPRVDPGLFLELVLSWDLRSYRHASAEPGVVFFDRALPELVDGYRHFGLPVPAHVLAAAQAFRYHPRVFIAPPWPEIYVQDRERTQTLDDAERAYESAVRAYTACGYELVTIPRADVDTRVAFVRQRVLAWHAPHPAPGRLSRC